MVVATIRVVLSLPGNDSLKGKRKVVRRVVDRAKHRFNASIAEVDSLDVHERAVLGACVVSNDAGHATAQIDKLVEMIASASEAAIVDRRMELITLGDADEAVGEWTQKSALEADTLESWRNVDERFGS